MVAKNSTYGKKRYTAFQHLVISLVFVFVFSGIVSFFVYQNVKVSHKRGDLEEQYGALRAQVSELEEQKLMLEESIEATTTPEYQEKILREEGLYKKPGEEVVTVLPPEVEVVSEDDSEGEKKVWWKPWTWIE
jgi:cell division protein FtsB